MKVSHNIKKIIWGLFFILAAVYVIVGKIWLIPQISVFSILLSVFCIWIFVNSIMHMNFGGILFPIAFICIIFAEPLNITQLTPWPVLGAAALGSIGLSFIFHKNKWHINGHIAASSTESEYSGAEIHCDNSFGQSIKYIKSDNFCNADLDNNFGSLTVYFDKAIVQSESATIKIDNCFGETNLYLPKSWNTHLDIDTAFGNVTQAGVPDDNCTITIQIQGSTNFGTLNIYYI